MVPVEVIITVKECLENPVYHYCGPVISGCPNQTTYFPSSTIQYAIHSVQFKFIIDIHSGVNAVSQCLIQICKNVRRRLVLEYFLNATVLTEFGLFLRGTWQVSVFIDAYPSWSVSHAICQYCIFLTWNWICLRSFRLFEDQRGLPSGIMQVVKF